MFNFRLLPTPYTGYQAMSNDWLSRQQTVSQRSADSLEKCCPLSSLSLDAMLGFGQPIRETLELVDVSPKDVQARSPKLRLPNVDSEASGQSSRIG